MIEYYRVVDGDNGLSHLRYDFETPAAAREQIEREVDQRAREAVHQVGESAVMHIRSEELADGRFTNIYDLSFDSAVVGTNVRVASRPRSVADFLTCTPDAIAAVSGAFLYLADQGSGTPRQQALNLALQENGYTPSLPVVDRETLLSDGNGRLSVRHLRAFGELMINDQAVTWSGSRTDYPAECRIFGNGNVVIRHALNDEVGARKERIRILEESSRFTPPIFSGDNLVDVGLIAGLGGKFRAVSKSDSGSLDLFAFDAVMRCSPELLRRDNRDRIQFCTVDTLMLDGSEQGALSVGPLLTEQDFASNSINNDPSLGSDPPFIDVPMVRLAVYESDDERVHIRLFDGRPESPSFKGVTPTEAVARIIAEHEVIWGCFLDPGRTAKIVTRSGRSMMSHGNAHYLQWPKHPGDSYVWVPTAGRPIPSALTFQ